MRVLIVTHRFPPFGLAGVERVTEQTALSLAEDGDEVTVLTRRESAAPPLPRLQRTTHRELDVLMITGGGPMHGRFPRHASRLERLFERTLLEIGPDIILVSHLMDHSPGYVAIAHRWQIPVVLELHDYYTICEQARLQRVSGELCAGPEGGRACAFYCFAAQDHSLERWALRTHMFHRALELVDALITPSQFVADRYTEIFGDTISTPRVIGNAVGFTTRAFHDGRREGPLRIAYVGAVVEHKGVHLIIEALELARLAKVELTLFGLEIQPYTRELLRRAKQIDGLRMSSFGTFDPTQLPALLTDIDLVIVPSIVSETFSIVIREAFVCGIPVVASRVGALPEGVRDGENGLLFTSESTGELAEILARLNRDRETLLRLRDGIRDDDWISASERAQRVRAVLAEVVDRPAGLPARVDELSELGILRDALSSFAPPA